LSAKPVIAIDGTAASGKGTIARALAKDYGFAHLDTGALYRSVAALTLKGGGDPACEADAVAACARFAPGLVPDAELRTAAIGEAASVVSVHKAVRAALLRYQKDFAANPPGAPGAVLDGRDIGTVICPDAAVKLFVTASVEERARRRHREFHDFGIAKSYDDILGELKARDLRDSTRAAAPLVQAADAILLDTTHLGVREAIDTARSIAATRL
jgi:CMP/dCMP kinase